MTQTAIDKINKFFIINVQENPETLFGVLENIIPFQSGYIWLSDKLTYTYNSQNPAENKLTGVLSIKNAPFGKLEITRENEFSKDEKIIFKTCTSIIANLIKDIEISKIINMQVKALQEGIAQTSRAYKSEKVKNDFFSNFSHELRTPLNSIISSAELLSEQIFGQLNDKQLEYINDIRIAGLHLLGMINDILDFVKLEAKSMKLNITNFALSDAANEVCNIIKPLALKKNIEISKKYSGNTMLAADYQKIQQIMFNLLTNAVKYTPENGKISIIIENSTIKIKDNGAGIDKKFHKKIFEKFIQLGSNKDSNGLGLTITKELVKLHKGRISVKSEPGKGCEFIVKLY